MSDSLIVACPHCHSRNRVPAARLGDAPTCGRCGAHLRPGTPFALDAGGFDAHAVRADAALLVDFWAPWCGPCKTLGPQLEAEVAKAKGRVVMAKVNVDENQMIAGQLRVQSIPTVYAFVNGQPVDGFQGAIPDSQIKAFIDKLTGGAGGAGACRAGRSSGHLSERGRRGQGGPARGGITGRRRAGASAPAARGWRPGARGGP